MRTRALHLQPAGPLHPQPPLPTELQWESLNSQVEASFKRYKENTSHTTLWNKFLWKSTLLNTICKKLTLDRFQLLLSDIDFVFLCFFPSSSLHFDPKLHYPLKVGVKMWSFCEFRCRLVKNEENNLKWEEKIRLSPQSIVKPPFPIHL